MQRGGMQAGAEPKVAVWSDKQQKLAMLDYNQDMAIRLFADDSDIFTLAPCQVGLVRFGLLLWLLSAGMMCSSQSELQGVSRNVARFRVLRITKHATHVSKHVPQLEITGLYCV